MERTSHQHSKLLEMIVEHIDIPKSLYDRAVARHKSLGEWLCRENSTIRQFDPDISPQGSFRYGLVNRPLDDDEEYDLDNVCVLKNLGKSQLTQKQLKHLYGEEIKAYARAHDMLAPVEEHNRCWRLPYADEVSFHLDSLPCVPEEDAVIRRLTVAGVPEELARRAVAITDRRHPQYEQITPAWFSSNPRGFAAWFEQRAALGRTRMIEEGLIRAAVEEVPPYEWKTPLQKSIQLLKRHRDVMFKKTPELAPISMIITNLSAHAYEGETDLWSALTNIVDGMPKFVRRARPWVPNPADPAEDYADKWATDSRLEKSFWQWHTAVKTLLTRLPAVPQRTNAASEIETWFDVTLRQEQLRALGVGTSAPLVATKTAPVLVVPSAPKPWGVND